MAVTTGTRCVQCNTAIIEENDRVFVPECGVSYHVRCAIREVERLGDVAHWIVEANRKVVGGDPFNEWEIARCVTCPKCNDQDVEFWNAALSADSDGDEVAHFAFSCSAGHAFKLALVVKSRTFQVCGKVIGASKADAVPLDDL